MNDRKKFGFLVHPRDLDDFFIKFPYLKILPGKVLNFTTRNYGPLNVSEVKGLYDIDGNPIPGHILGITVTAHQMMEDRDHALKKIKEAVRLAKKLDIGILGLGALTSSFSKGGLDVTGMGVGINAGRAYTVKNINNYVHFFVEKFNLDISKIKVGIVGAAGSIGSSSATYMAKQGFRNFILIDLEHKLEDAKSNIDPSHQANIEITHQMKSLSECDIVIAATNAPEVVIKPDDLKSGAIVINDAQPSDISPEVLKERDDVIVVEGGVVRIKGLNNGFNFRLAKREDTFSCMTESIILAANNHFEDFAIGRLDLSMVDKITEMSKKVPGLSIAPQNALFEIDEEYIQKISKIINSHKTPEKV